MKTLKQDFAVHFLEPVCILLTEKYFSTRFIVTQIISFHSTYLLKNLVDCF